MVWRSAVVLLIGVAAQFTWADSANIRIVKERQFPEGWTEPEITTNEGATSVKPSVPSGFKTRDVGAVLDIGASTVHLKGASTDAVNVPVDVTYKYRLRLPTGIVANLKLGKWANVGHDMVRLLKGRDGTYFLQYRKTGRILRLRRKTAP